MHVGYQHQGVEAFRIIICESHAQIRAIFNYLPKLRKIISYGSNVKVS